MLRRTSWWLAVLLLVLAMALVACGGEEPAAETDTGVEEVETEPEQEVVAEPEEEVAEPEVEEPVAEEPPEEEEMAEEGFPEGTQLQILQWSHFVPRYDEWFDQFAADWGGANGVNVTVDHQDIASVDPSLVAAMDAGEGPTLVELSVGASKNVDGLHDLADLVARAEELYGPMNDTCRNNSYLPANDMWYGFCHGWVPDPGDYDISLWTEAGFPNGPSTWQELLEGGTFIRDELGVPMGIGLSPEIDSNLAMRALIWSFGGSIQDENECVVIDSPEVLEAVEFLVELYNNTMTEEVFAWTAASNNQGLIAGELSFILNSISAYRSLQRIDPEAAANIGFTPALAGPRGDQHAAAHLWFIYVIPSYVEKDSPEYRAAEEFILHLLENYDDASYNSELYNFPAFAPTAPTLPEWIENDPFESEPADKLAFLKDAEQWVTYLGYPGPSNPAVAEVYSLNIIPTMMGRAARGDVTPEEAIAEAEAQINDIFASWRDRGLVGCTDQ
ncbi:MAG: extracellular solute-binding protein [Anaerolineae bacterium]|nr:extracellular solute-binding protein [Anaerolineae bacterium]